ncbi:Peptidase S8/S53, subtilisin/kexin/sedolisin [Metarhizium guizhouense ARSEF 977]|uniref:Peptidase S8/S53, subtilisin/kexin/sedolisin n=1 Tax=Metarhizium guizhouense (strain ARSEF 977) TaxID=1276136 RepID=A0A0B4GI81_METGA|nr:Peptidase S8/S53, subtilisin/kexin/sedolisin [Metarhizium guizhouense ARSEF 977]
MGKSFSHYPNSTEFMNSYFVPSGKHGTQMAKLITQICPDPRLFITRLEERLAPDSSGRCITAESAAKAVIWAVDRKVDIISMSWTTEKKSAQFLLPGKRIPIKNSDGKSHSYETGSSLATACASRLAGLLLHCERLLGRKVIVNKKKIENVFKVLAQWGQFPHVRPYFDKHFKGLYGNEIGNKTALGDLPKLDWDDKTRETLENLMTALTTHISAEQVGG